jgi:hypothetical protein
MTWIRDSITRSVTGMCSWPNLARLEKPDCPVCQIGVSSFGSFRDKPRKELNLKIQGVLKLEEGLKGIKGPRYNKIKQEAEVTKTEPSDLSNWTIWFFQIS